jgi:L-threonylcarbamoyladenylate synthase
VAEQLGDTIDGIVDGGPCSVGVESTIIAFPEGTPVILRPGAVTPRDDSSSGRFRGNKTIRISSRTSDACARHDGQTLPAPSTLFLWIRSRKLHTPPPYRAYCFWKNKSVIDSTLNLSPTGNLTEATANLYAYMRALDKEKYDLILVDSIPDEGVGIACNDRLRRASLKHL